MEFVVALYHSVANDYIFHYNNRSENKKIINYDYLNCYYSLLSKRVRAWAWVDARSGKGSFGGTRIFALNFVPSQHPIKPNAR